MDSVMRNLGAFSVDSGSMETESIVYGSKEEMEDDVEQVYETLRDVLTRYVKPLSCHIAMLTL